MEVRRFTIILFISLLACSAKTMAQDTMSQCDCFRISDTSFMQPVKFTLGGDSAKPPFYTNNVNTSQKLKLPFNFCFYGKNYDSVYIGNKGNITFIKPIHTFTTGNFPAGTDTAMIAPFWADINNYPVGPQPPDIGQVYYKIYPKRLDIIWYNVLFYRFDCDVYNSFKLTISDGTDPEIPGGNNVDFCYYNMAWSSADSSGGNGSGFAGIPCMVGINKGDKVAYAQIGRFNLPGSSFAGIDSTTNGTYWLDHKSFIFNTCVTEKNIPPVIINPIFCDTVQVCQWDTAEYAQSFLCAIPGQKATLSANSATFTPIIKDTVTASNGIQTIKIKVPTNFSVLGYNTVNITATDNSVPPQTATYPVVFNVDVCTGINEVSENSGGFSVYPNSNDGRFTVELNKGQTPENIMIRIYDVQGKEVCSDMVTGTKTEINITGQSKGIYFVKLLRNTTEIGVKKISVQ